VLRIDAQQVGDDMAITADKEHVAYWVSDGIHIFQFSWPAGVK
jgi:hypothetical protein